MGLKDGARVGAWGAFVQDTPANQPIWRMTGGYRNLPYVEFRANSKASMNGKDVINFRMMSNGGFTYVLLAKFNWAAAQPLAPPALLEPLLQGRSSINMRVGDPLSIRRAATDPSKLALTLDGPGTATIPKATSILNDTWYVVTYRYARRTDSTIVRVNGQTAHESSGGGGSIRIADQQLRLGLGADPIDPISSTTGQYGNFDLGALIAYDRPLTDAELAGLENFVYSGHASVGDNVLNTLSSIRGSVPQLPVPVIDLQPKYLINSIDGSGVAAWNVFSMPDVIRQPRFRKSGGYGNQAFVEFDYRKRHHMVTPRPLSMKCKSQNGLTVMLLIRLTGSPENSQRILDGMNMNNTQDVLTISRHLTNPQFSFSALDNGTQITPGTTDLIKQNTWYILTYDYNAVSQKVRIYVDLKQVAEANGRLAQDFPRVQFGLGTDIKDGKRAFLGSFDLGAMLVYDRPLTGVEFLQLYKYLYTGQASMVAPLPLSKTPGPTAIPAGPVVNLQPKFLHNITLQQSATGINAITSAPVESWTGSSFVQPNAAQRPVLLFGPQYAGYQGRPAVSFSADRKTFLKTAQPVQMRCADNGGMSFIVLLKMRAPVSAFERIVQGVFASSPTNDAVGIYREKTGDRLVFMAEGIGYITLTEPTALDSWDIYSYVYNTSAATVVIRKNNREIATIRTTNAPGMSPVPNMTVSLSLGCDMNTRAPSGVTATPSLFGNFDIGAFLMYDRALAPRDMDLLYAYVADGRASTFMEDFTTTPRENH